MKKVLYLASGKGKLEHSNVVYQDKFIKRDLGGDMLEVDLTGYDLIVASPPCNFYSRANYRRYTSKYSQETKHLLPETIKMLEKLTIPVIVENVRNPNLLKDIILNTKLFYYEYGRHVYFTNRIFEFRGIEQRLDNIQAKSVIARQGGNNVNNVFNEFIKTFLEE